ncbi:MAG: zf-HC2 domain-containing protein, partial [Chloroflexi bacterium]|nr:zf-HC2 domain-containing protein [Chloroflexota bacterium]
MGDQELSAYVDGQLPSAARARLEEHVQACAACREALEELRALRGALRELPRAAA